MHEDVQAARRSTFPQGSHIRTASRSNLSPPHLFTNSAEITRSAVMIELEPEREEDEPEALRSAAVEALQSAARQSDPKESDRLTRHGLALIERARAIGHRRRNGISEVDAAPVRNAHRMQEEERPRRSRSLTAKLVATLRRLCSWRPGH
jgi:hypothetical protein